MQSGKRRNYARWSLIRSFCKVGAAFRGLCYAIGLIRDGRPGCSRGSRVALGEQRQGYASIEILEYRSREMGGGSGGGGGSLSFVHGHIPLLYPTGPIIF